MFLSLQNFTTNFKGQKECFTVLKQKLTLDNKTSLQRKIERITHDPNRIYEGKTVADFLPSIKAVRLG